MYKKYKNYIITILNNVICFLKRCADVAIRFSIILGDIREICSNIFNVLVEGGLVIR